MKLHHFSTVALSLCVLALIPAGDKLHIFTDGSFSDNHCGWAIVADLQHQDDSFAFLGQVRGHTSDDRWASIFLTTLLKCSRLSPLPPVTPLHTRLPNSPLGWPQAAHQLAPFSFQHISAHACLPWNELADCLAGSAVACSVSQPRPIHDHLAFHGSPDHLCDELPWVFPWPRLFWVNASRVLPPSFSVFTPEKEKEKRERKSDAIL